MKQSSICGPRTHKTMHDILLSSVVKPITTTEHLPTPSSLALSKIPICLMRRSMGQQDSLRIGSCHNQARFGRDATK